LAADRQNKQEHAGAKSSVRNTAPCGFDEPPKKELPQEDSPVRSQAADTGSDYPAAVDM